MKNLLPILLMTCLIGQVALAEQATFINYERGIYEKAKHQAAQEGKLLFLDFYAKWCMPCKWMDETTFSDRTVISKLKEDYIAIKVDIDEMEGFELKSRFDIRYLPTILIFNTEGKMVERIEETLSPSRLKEVLDRYDTTTPASVVRYGFNTSPKDIARVEKDEILLTDEEYDRYFAQNNVRFRIQLGVYSSREGAGKQAAALRETFLDEVVVLEEEYDGSPLYRVVMGNFGSVSEAESFRKILTKEHQMESVLYTPSL